MTKTNTKPIVSMSIECQKVQSLSLKPKPDSRNLLETHFPFAFCTLIQDKTNTSSESIVSAQELDVRTYVYFHFCFSQHIPLQRLHKFKISKKIFSQMHTFYFNQGSIKRHFFSSQQFLYRTHRSPDSDNCLWRYLL